MSRLIDDIVFENINDQVLRESKSADESPWPRKKFWIAKPIGLWSFQKIFDAFRVLTNKSFAVHYKEDEVG